MHRNRLAFLSLCIPLLSGCNEALTSTSTGPVTMEITVLSGEFGTEENPLDPTTVENDGISRDWPERTYQLKVRALLNDGTPDTSFNRPVHLKTIPGQIVGSEWVDLVAGEGTLTVTIEKVFGASRVWVEDINSADFSEASYATGVTPFIYIGQPTIADLQYVPPEDTAISNNGETLNSYEFNALPGTYVSLKTEGRQIVVTQLLTNGFYVTDCTDGTDATNPCADANGQYNSLFVFSYSAPKDLYPGDVLSVLTGNVAEFYGSTQLSFPQWVVDTSQRMTAPEPGKVSSSSFCADSEHTAFEAHEADLVRFEKLTVADFANDAAALNGYLEHGQWPAVVSGAGTNNPCEVMVVSGDTIPSFDPLAHPGMTLDFVQGSLGTYASEYSDYVIYIVQPRGTQDMGCDGGSCASL